VPTVQSRLSESSAAVPRQREPVERVIQAMHDKLEDPFGLSSMAKVAFLSRFHFNRTFRRVTGIPPTRFLYALRIATARRLLLQTQMRVIDICYEVGYNSLGTFTRRFTELLGASPARFRVLARSSQYGRINPANSPQEMQPPSYANASRRLSGRVHAPADFRGLILIGLFDAAIPEGKPRSCAMVSQSGSFEIVSPPEGKYFLFALALDVSADIITCWDCESTLRGGGQQIFIRGDRIQGDTTLHLRSKNVTDPPILLAIPLLVSRFGRD
jgi:AraC family transcriptional regulator